MFDKIEDSYTSANKEFFHQATSYKASLEAIQQAMIDNHILHHTVFHTLLHLYQHHHHIKSNH